MKYPFEELNWRELGPRQCIWFIDICAKAITPAKSNYGASQTKSISAIIDWIDGIIVENAFHNDDLLALTDIQARLRSAVNSNYARSTRSQTTCREIVEGTSTSRAVPTQAPNSLNRFEATVITAANQPALGSSGQIGQVEMSSQSPNETSNSQEGSYEQMLLAKERLSQCIDVFAAYSCAAVRQLSEQMKTLAEQNASKQQELSLAERRICDLQDHLRTAEEELRQLEEQYARLSQSYEEETGRVSRLEAELSSKEQALAQRHQDMQTLQHQMEEQKERAIERRDMVIRDAMRAQTEEISESIAHVVKEFLDWKHDPDLPDPVSHLEGLMESILNTLKTKNIAIVR